MKITTTYKYAMQRYMRSSNSKESFHSHKAEINQILEEAEMKGMNLGDERKESWR